MRIVFVAGRRLEAWPDIESLDAGSVDAHPSRFRSGVDVWVIQSYLRLSQRLRERGFEPRIAKHFEPGALCVAHRDDLNAYACGAHRSLVAGVRADRPPLRVGHWCIVQNALGTPGERERHIPQWPQPGLLGRARERGSAVRRLAYLGRATSAPRWYRDPEFARRLRELGVEFVIREDAWHDYRDVDAVIAHRDEAPTMLALKPATKLANAWLGGAPAILQPEPAFEELRRSPLDFLPARGPEEVLDAVRRLQAGAGLFESMVRNGHDRARQFSVSAVEKAWLGFLADEAAPRWEQWRHAALPTSVAWFTFIWMLSIQKLEAKQFRRRLRRELLALAAHPSAPR